MSDQRFIHVGVIVSLVMILAGLLVLLQVWASSRTVQCDASTLEEISDSYPAWEYKCEGGVRVVVVD